ncbi:hypothetical protein GQ53DRAFT_878208 [Thozetella sp. PMI_491]|nr:hypothetical protein GQ53DRAFT_878208 [Thozetella sp. PMI_491]
MALHRVALGQPACLGGFYDARADKFLASSLFNKLLPSSAILSSSLKETSFKVVFSDSFRDKFEAMGIQMELGASILAGLVMARGSGAYLNEANDSNQVLHAAIYHKFIDTHEKLQLHTSNISGFVDPKPTLACEITHIVTDTYWGAQNIISLRHRIGAGADAATTESTFRAEVERFAKALETGYDTGHAHLAKFKSQLTLSITMYSDVLDQEGIPMNDAAEVLKFLSTEKKESRYVPLAYRLLPISMLDVLGIRIKVKTENSQGITSLESLKKFARLFDEFNTSQRKLNDHHALVKRQHDYVSYEHLQYVAYEVSALPRVRSELQREYEKVLRDVRQGRGNAEALSHLHDKFSTGPRSPAKIASIVDESQEKISFVTRAVQDGAAYIGHSQPDLDVVLAQRGTSEAYVLSLSQHAVQQPTWNANKDLLLELLRKAPPGALMAILDCDVLGAPLETACLSHYRDGQFVVHDVVAQKQFLSQKCIARYHKDSLETENVERPLKRRFVKIPCPSPDCSGDKGCEWHCSECMALLEYGYTDQFIYCDCGRSSYEKFEFRCNDSSHQQSFRPYDTKRLSQLLKNLESGNNLNILILGETGVGKSTFINAFVNYLHFETLGDAMKAEKLNSVMPCSFQLQLMDRDSTEGEIKEVQISVGEARDDERDGSTGESATQKTTVYPIVVGNRTIRLIDTPGIGDTRGLSYDKKNMADILATLGSYDDLHGILILLKPNNARLTVMFNFCMKELLTHLHRNAVANIAFGFTNTRISNYNPGDTFGPLKSLLGEHKDIGLRLSAHTTYCFDSESFRYLAALKAGHQIPNEEDFRRSWEHSRKESMRLLDHFSTAHPHSIVSTVSMNGTRMLIQGLTKPMADISVVIQANIDLCKEKIEEMKKTRLSGHKLRQRLMVRKVHLRPKILPKPRTVCSDQTCCDFKDDGSGSNVVTIYKSHCHPECHLKGIHADTVAHPGLIHCWAFMGCQTCRTCGHNWQQHMHVLFELEEYTAMETDTEVERQIRNNANDVTLKQAAIQAHEQLIKEYKEERDLIRTATAHFGLFLKQNAITAYNDATIRYLDHLIQNEEDKIAAAEQSKLSFDGNKRRLASLQEDKRKHIALVEALAESMEGPGGHSHALDMEGVKRKVNQLYELKHFGQNLQSVKEIVTEAHKAERRERPFRMEMGNCVTQSAMWAYNKFKGLSRAWKG